MKYLQLIAIFSASALLALTVFLLSRPKPISQEQAIEIATMYMKEQESSVDISYGLRGMTFSENAFWIGSKEKGVWTISFGIPAPPHYSRRIISRHIHIDRYGRLLLPSSTTSP